MFAARASSCLCALGLLIAGADGASAQAAAPSAVVATAKLSPVIYAVTLNGRKVSDGAMLLSNARGELFVGAADLEDWHVAAPAVAPVSAEGGRYYALGAFAGATATVDEATETVALSVPATLLAKTVVALRRAGPVKAQSGRGAFLDYDLNAQRAGSFALAGATLDAGTYLAGGLFESQVAAYSGGGRAYVRPTIASWSRDDAARRATLRLGDGYTSGGTFAQNLPFVGVQWSTNLATDPAAMLQVQPTFSGVAAEASVVQVYANGQLVASGVVPAGPFAIPAAGAGTGAQHYTVVVTDAQGRRSVASQPGYTDASLLRAGATEFSYAAGRAYAQLGAAGGTRLLAQAVQRRGVTDRLTAEIAASTGIETLLGGDLLWSPGRVGTFIAGAAYHAAGGAATVLHDFGYSYVTPRWSLVARTRTSPNLYTEVAGGNALHAGVDRQTSVQGAWRFGAHARARLEYQAARSALLDESRSLALSFVRDSRDGSFIVSTSHQSGATRLTSVEVGLSRRFGRNENLYVGGGHGGVDGGTVRTPTVQFDAPAPVGNGLGVSLGSDSRNGIPFAAQLVDRTPFVDASLAHTRELDASLDDVRVRGGIALVGGRAYATRWLDSSFALVSTGYADLPVYANNVLVGRTDRHGDAFVRDLAPYRGNAITVDPSALPLGVELETDRTVVPAPRAGLRVRFATASTGAVQFRLRVLGGAFVPAGSTIAQVGGTLATFAGTDGQVYLENVRAGTLHLQVSFGDGACDATVAIPADIAATPDLGTVVCR